MWKLNLETIEEFLDRHGNDLDSLQIEDFHNLVSGLNDFFEEKSNMSIHNDYQIEIFASIALESTDIVHVMGSFHGKPMFSNVTISAKDEENDVAWYGLVRKFIIFQYILSFTHAYFIYTRYC